MNAAQDGWFGILGLEARDMSFREEDDNGQTLVREDGLLPGLLIGAGYKYSDWEVSGQVTGLIGKVDYRGKTTLGNTHSTKTDERFIESELMLGHTGSMKDLNLQPYGGVGYRYWSRDIKSTSSVLGIDETYTWWSGFVGMRFIVTETSKASLTIDARLNYTLNPKVEVDFLSDHDSITLPLDNRPGIRILLSWKHALGDRRAILVEPYFEQYGFGRSDTKPLTIAGSVVGTVFEPKSTTRNVGVRVKYAFP